MSMLKGGLFAGGLSAAGSLASTGISSALGMYNSKKSAKRAYQYYLSSLREGPLAQVQGLRKANLNPLLATGLGATDASVPVAPVHPGVDNPVSSALDGAVKAEAIAEKKNALKNADNESDILEAEKDAVVAESSARQAQAYTDQLEAVAASAALTGERPIIRVNDQRSVYESPQFDRIVKKLENQIEYDSHMRSKNHALWEDGINAIHGINQGASAYENWKSARRSYNSSGRYRR